MNTRLLRSRLLAVCIVVAAQLLSTPVAAAGSGSGSVTHTIEYRGYAVDVPTSWPIFDLSLDPTRCVAFSAHAVFLGQPGATEDCPPHAVGRTEAILVQPLTSVTASQVARATATEAGRLVPAGVVPAFQEVSFAVAGANVFVTATWHLEPALVWTVLTSGRLTPAAVGASVRRDTPVASPQASDITAGGAASFTGLGFDACTAPSASSMSAWGSNSPYSAVGIYIGGVNRGCAQANLTANWVGSQIAARWRMIPTYVGLQAPTNACQCSSISPPNASSEGLAAADDAVTQAIALGMRAGTPIYYDMENYVRGATNTPAVLSFLSAWTSRLHANGYVSGVYSSGSSGIADLVSQYGTAYQEPDDLWIGDWNGQRTVVDPYVPAGQWSNHQRLHQYQGGHTESYAGVSINIDGDYLDGAVYTVAQLPTSPLYTLDGFGGVHAVGVAPTLATTAYWRGRDIARGIVALTDHSGGYVLDGFGGIHTFGFAPPLTGTGYWPGWDIARGIALTPSGLGGWVLDGWGGVHQFGNAPALESTGYWAGWDIARGIAADSTGKGGWVLDGFGGLHPFGDAPTLTSTGYWPGWDIARGIAMTPSGLGGYVLDGFGGLHQFGDAVTVTGEDYWPNWKIARGIVMSGASSSTNPGGWVVDGFGGVHQFGSAPPETATGYWPGWDIVRGVG